MKLFKSTLTLSVCTLVVSPTARIAAELYPQSDRANVFYGISLTLVGSKDAARNALRKAVAISSKGIASTGAFNQIALAIAGADKLDAAIDWLGIATEIYPTDANLFGTLGDLYQKSGRQDLAVEAYKKALAIDPSFEKAKENSSNNHKAPKSPAPGEAC